MSRMEQEAMAKKRDGGGYSFHLDVGTYEVLDFWKGRAENQA